MSFLDQLRAAAESPASAWHQFVLGHRSGVETWYLFVEGKFDVAYYSSALRGAGDLDSLSAFLCGGREGVFETRRRVRRSHPFCSRCLFFVDRDWSDFLGGGDTEHADLYVTDGYSVENHLVSVESLRIVWREVWTMPSQDPRLSIVEKRFEEALNRFHRLMLPVMSWAVLARQEECAPNLNNVGMERLVDMADCSPRFIGGRYEYLRRCTSCEFRPSLERWLRTVRELRNYDSKTVVRGKNELWFFARFLSELFVALRTESVGPRPLGAIQMTVDALMSLLPGKIQPSEGLKKFLARAVRSRHGRDCEGGK